MEAGELGLGLQCICPPAERKGVCKLSGEKGTEGSGYRKQAVEGF